MGLCFLLEDLSSRKADLVTTKSVKPDSKFRSFRSDKSTEDRPPFVRRHWWGLLCLLAIIFAWIAGVNPTVRSSADFGGIYFFTKPSPEATLVIRDAPESFKIQVQGEKTLYHSRMKKLGGQTAYHITWAGKDIRIDGLQPNLSESNIEAEWNHDSVSIRPAGDGTRVVSAGYDVPGQALDGVYSIKDDTIYDHYFSQSRLLIAVIVTLVVVPVYLVGRFCIWLIGWLRNKKDSSAPED